MKTSREANQQAILCGSENIPTNVIQAPQKSNNSVRKNCQMFPLYNHFHHLLNQEVQPCNDNINNVGQSTDHVSDLILSDSTPCGKTDLGSCLRCVEEKLVRIGSYNPRL